MTSEDAKNHCLQYIWKWRQRVVLPTGEWFILESFPLVAKTQKLSATWTSELDQNVHIDIETSGADAEQLLITCLEEAIQEATH